MNKIISLYIVLMLTFFKFYGQNKTYKEYDVCTNWDTYKGKVNHGKKYCISWSTVREYKDGRRDTLVYRSFGVSMFDLEEYETYQKLPERSKYIVDSLKEDGIPSLHSNYLNYEPTFMKVGKKRQQLWSTESGEVKIYEYLLWKNSKEEGFKLLREFIIK